jgi:hypothetical protein
VHAEIHNGRENSLPGMGSGLQASELVTIWYEVHFQRIEFSRSIRRSLKASSNISLLLLDFMG